VDPGGRLAQRLHVAPRPGRAGGPVDGRALGLAEALAHIKGHPRIVLAAGAVATLPDAAERIPHRDAAAVCAAGQVPGLHRRDGSPEHRAVRSAPELPQGQGPAGAVGHGVVLAQAVIGVDLVFVGIVNKQPCHWVIPPPNHMRSSAPAVPPRSRGQRCLLQARPRLRGLHSHRLRRAEGRIIPHEALPAAEVRPAVDPLFDLHHIRADAPFLHGTARICHLPCRIPVRVGHPGRQLQAQRLHRRPGLGVRDAGLRQSEQRLRTAGRGGRLPGVAGGQRRCLHALEVIGDPPQQDGVIQHVAALAAHRQRLTGVRQPFQRDHRAAAAQS